MTNKNAQPIDKQFVILPNEVEPKFAAVKAHQAVQKALISLKNGRRK